MSDRSDKSSNHSPSQNNNSGIGAPMSGTGNNQTGGTGGRNDLHAGSTDTTTQRSEPAGEGTASATPAPSTHAAAKGTRDPDTGANVSGHGSSPTSPPASSAPSTHWHEPLEVRPSSVAMPEESPSFSAHVMPPAQTEASPSLPEPAHPSSNPGLLVGPNDTVLVINFQDQLGPPKGLTDFDDLSCGRQGVLRVNQPGIGQRLRDTRIDVSAWEQAMSEIRKVLEVLKGRSFSQTHVFFNGPHPLALWLGHQLEVIGRQQKVLIYQFDVGQKDWILYLDMKQASTGRGSKKLSNARVEGAPTAQREGTVLSLEIIQHANPLQLEALRNAVGARDIKRINSPAPGTAIEAGMEALDALNLVFEELSTVRTDAQGEPIYLATSAPVALIIGLGYRIPRSVFPLVWGCYYDAEQAKYLAVLEVTRPQIAQALRPRLEVIGKPHGLLYRFNGKLLEAVGNPLEGWDGIDRRTEFSAPLMEGVKNLSLAILPEEVEREIADLPTLDIELKLTGPSAELSWELVSLNRGGYWDDPVTLRAGWTLTRQYSPKRPVREQPLLHRGQLRVMIVPSLNKNDARFSAEEAEKALKLKDLGAWMSEQEVSVLRLEYGVSLAEVEQELRTFKPHVLHWIGHGNPDAGAGTPDVLELSDWDASRSLDRTRIPQFTQLAGPDLRLVVLQACSAVGPSNGYGVPGLLIERGVGAVIGYRDTAGINELHWFNSAFYPALLRGESIRDALAAARSAIHRSRGLPASFASPILCAASARAVGPLVKAAHRG